MRNGDCACAILWRRGRLLLAKRGPHRRAYPNRWDVLGGRVEPGESLEEALIRELREEVGLVPRSFMKLAVISDPNPPAQSIAHYHIHVVDRWDGGDPRIQDQEHTELRWFSVSEACLQPDLALPVYRDLFRKLDAS